MNVAIYARVSTQEQAQNGSSITEQISRMRDFCRAMSWTVSDEFIDAGYSGANTNRPSLQRLVIATESHKHDKVLVYKLDRLSRSQKDTLELIEDVFLAHDVDFVSMSENFDTATPFGRAMIGILAVFAQLEREQIKERMMMGLDARAKQGKFSGTRYVPIGYDYENGELTVNAYESMQVRTVFEEYAKGKSPQTIATELNHAGMHHKHGKWSRQTVRNVLHSQLYTGMIKYQDKWLQGIHEPIIDEDLFSLCEMINKKKAHEYTYMSRRGKVNSYLGGLIECAHCHSTYIKRSQTFNGKKYEYYKCTSIDRRWTKDVPDCHNKTWRVSDLDALVFGEIKKLALDPEYLNSAKQKTSDERPSLIKSELARIDSKLSKLLDLYSIEGMPLDVLKDHTEALRQDRERLETELTRIEDENASQLTHDEIIQTAQSFGDILDAGDFDEIRAVVTTLIDKIVIDNEDVTIHWCFS